DLRELAGGKDVAVPRHLRLLLDDRRQLDDVHRRDDLDLVAGREEVRRIAARVPQRRGGAPEEVPAAGRLDGVEAGECAGDGERARRNSVARCGAARHAPSLGPTVEVGEAGAEAEE